MQDPLISRPRAAALRTMLLVSLALVASNACEDESSLVSVPFAADVSSDEIDATAALASIDDALLRIVPALGESADVEPLRAALGELHSMLADRHRAAAEPYVVAVRLALDAYRAGAGAGADGAELDAVRLALEAAAEIRRAPEAVR